MKTHAWKRLCLGLVVASLLVSLSGCELFFASPEAAWLAEEFFDEWVAAKDMSPTNADGGVDPAGAAKLGKRLLTDSTGDEESDAALDRDWIANIAEADALADQARKDRDAVKIAQAIEKRPDDYAYRAYAAVIAAENGDEAGWKSELETGDELTQEGGKDRENYAYILIAESGNAIGRLYAEGTLYTDPERCERLHNTEAEAYELLYDAKGDPRDLEASRISRDRGKFDCYKK